MIPPVPQILDELELDAFGELVNIGVSKSAASLREMIGEQVHLSVPTLSLVSRHQAIEMLNQEGHGNLIAVHQVFEGDITGRAILIFPEAKSLELVRAVAGGGLSLEDIVELEHEALAETGNIILNGCLSTIANLLQRSFKMSLPEILRGSGSDLFEMESSPEAGEHVLFLYINFAVRQRDILGYIVMLMDLPSIAALKVLLVEFIERTTGVKAPRPDEIP